MIRVLFAPIKQNFILRLLYLAIVIVLILQITIAFQSVEYLVQHVTNDDTFYYLQFAYNVAQGLGPTFDGIHRANGVQPLWAMLLTLLAGITADKIPLLRGCLLAAAALNAGSGFLLLRLLRLVFRDCRIAEIFGIGAFLAFQLQSGHFLTGMESSLNLFVFLAALLLTVKIVSYDARVDSFLFKQMGMLGVVGMLLVMARVDNIVYVPWMVLGGSIALYRAGQARAIHRVDFVTGILRSSVMIGVPSLIFIVCYAFWNWYQLGYLLPLPVSALVKRAGHYTSVVEPLGGYLSLSYVSFTLTSFLEETRKIMAELLGPLWFGRTHWLAGNALLVILLTAAISLSFVVATILRNRRATIGRVLMRPERWIGRLWGILLLFWSVYSTIPYVLGIATYATKWAKLATTIVCIVLGFVIAGEVPSSAYDTLTTSKSSDIRVLWRFGWLKSFFDVLTRRRAPILWFSLIVICILHLFFTVFFAGSQLIYTRWYLVPQYVLLILMFSYVISSCIQATGGWGRVMLSSVIVTWTSVALLWAFLATGMRLRDETELPLNATRGHYETAKWVRNNLPVNSRIGCFNAGIMGYFSERTVINLDGLMNDYEYAERIIQGKLGIMEYLDSNHVEYVADYVRGAYDEFHLPPTEAILGIPRQRLIPVLSMHGEFWYNETFPITFFVFKLKPVQTR
jgi:hypothetical protein